MFLFIDGEVVILTVEQNIELYFQAYLKEFGEISRTRWNLSKEYEIAYSNAQRDNQNAMIIEQGLQLVFDSISEINESIKRPAVLHSRVAERFLEEINTMTGEGYTATIRVADLANKGIVAICVDYDPAAEQNTQIAALIVDEMLPAGQFIEGDISESVALTNGQAVLAQWKVPVEHTIDFKITLTVDRNSGFAIDTAEDIAEKFLANFAAQNPLGQDVTPATYYTLVDAPWAAQIETTYDIDTSGTYIGTITESNFDDKYFPATLDPVNVTIIE